MESNRWFFIPIRWGLFFTSKPPPPFLATHLNGAKHPWLWNTLGDVSSKSPMVPLLGLVRLETDEIWVSKCIWKWGQCLGQVVFIVHHSFFGEKPWWNCFLPWFCTPWRNVSFSSSKGLKAHLEVSLAAGRWCPSWPLIVPDYAWFVFDTEWHCISSHKGARIQILQIVCHHFEQDCIEWETLKSRCLYKRWQMQICPTMEPDYCPSFLDVAEAVSSWKSWFQRMCTELSVGEMFNGLVCWGKSTGNHGFYHQI